MKAYVTALLAAGALALTLGVSEPAYAKHGGWGWHGGHWHGGWGWGGWGPRWGWRGWGWGPRVGIYVGPGVYGRRCWSRKYGWVPCRWYY